jgi:hypothetical protein
MRSAKSGIFRGALLLFLMNVRKNKKQQNGFLALSRLQRGLRVISPRIGHHLKPPDVRMKGVTSFLTRGAGAAMESHYSAQSSGCLDPASP